MFKAYLNKLKELVINKTGLTFECGPDFDLFSDTILKELNVFVSSSTLKRFFGFEMSNNNPSLNTCSILCRYVGFNSWSDFCNQPDQPEFDTEQAILSKDLNFGDVIEFQWMPNCQCVAQYLGDNEYEIVGSLNSKFKPGDRFIMEEFRLKQPLYLKIVFEAYSQKKCNLESVAGSQSGVTYLKKRISVIR